MNVKLPECLYGAGALGHTWVTTCLGSAPGEHNAESIYCQASFGADAVRALDELSGSVGQPGHLYERRGRSWKRVSRAYAMLDQPPDRPYEPAVQS
jgi:hypothetical protein